MSTNLPLRTIRIPALQRQCLFLRHQQLRDQPFAASASRTFSSTAPNAYRKKSGASLKQDKSQTTSAARGQVGASPNVFYDNAQRGENAMAEDIGLLQGTIIRAPFRDLPSPMSWQFWSYFWGLFRSKFVALYSRSAYQRCMYKIGLKRWQPVDAFNSRQLKDRAEKLYTQIYSGFARGDIKPIQQICLPPLTQKFQSRIAARDPIKMDWQLKKFKSTRIVSHRASPLGEDHPDTAYRQVVFRIESVQSLSVQAGRQRNDAGRQRNDEAPKTVVEYLVLQRRVISGREEEWKVWGFAEESTPARIEDDEAYWARTLAMQTASGERMSG